MKLTGKSPSKIKSWSANQSARQDNFEKLVDELMKDEPCITTVKSLSKNLGIPYFLDAAKMLSSVIDSANRVYFQNNQNKLGSQPNQKKTKEGVL